MALNLAACGGDKSEYIQPLNPHAGIWRGKDSAEEMRKTKALDSNCAQQNADGYIAAMFIDKNGIIYDYDIDTSSKESVKKVGSVTRDGKVTINRGAGVQGQASLQGDNLTITVTENMPFHVHYTRSTKQEVASFSGLKTLCKRDGLTGNL